MLRILLLTICAAALAWCGYWVFGAKLTERQISRWLDARAAEGWVANYGDVGTRGFPYRFDTTIRDIDLADPDTGLAWRAAFIQFLSLSYRPHHLIAVWPEQQTFATPDETVTIRSDDMRASLVLQAGPRLPLDRITVEGGNVAMLSTADWRMRAARAQLALRQNPDRAQTYDVALNMEEVAPPEGWERLAQRAGLSVAEVGRADLEATVRFDAVWDLDALEVARPQPRQIQIDRARILWGELSLQVRGDLEVDRRGRADGELTVRASNWRGMLDVARDSGLLSREVADLVEGGLNLIARVSGKNDAIDVPLTFRNGSVTLGGVVPLGSAPRLILR